MKEIPTLIIGASVSGLASAASLKKYDIEYLIIEKEAQVAAPGAIIIIGSTYTPIKFIQSSL